MTNPTTREPQRVAALVCSALEPEFAGVANASIELGYPGAGEIQVRVGAAALNFPDLLMTRGLYQHKPDLPFVPGMEGAGRVTAVGPGVKDFNPGDPVRFSCRSGACAEAINVSADRAWPVPPGFSFAQAAAFQVGALTAYVGLIRRGGLQSGETLLVHGAGGGMGLAAVQLGAHLGATVIATGSSDDKLAVAGKLGAHHLLNICEGRGFRDQVKTLTAGRGADVVFDPVGGDVFDESIRVVAWGGRLLIIGFTSGRIPQFSVNMALIKGFSVVGVRAGEYGRRDPAGGLANERALNALAAQGALTPHIGANFPLSEGVAALRALQSRAIAGKIVVEPHAVSAFA